MNYHNKLSLKNKKLKILFRISGGRASKKELGFGHVFRSINLSKKFLKHKIFFLVEDYGGVKAVLEKNEIKNSIYLPKKLKLEKDIILTEKILEKENIDVLIVDKYNIDIRYFKTIQDKVKIVYISDLKKIQFPVDLVVNGFIGFKNKIIKNKYNSKCLVGPKYQIINEKFNVNKSKKKSVDLLVTFGGFDEIGLTDLVFKRWLNMNKKFKIKIILGPGTKESKFIKKYKKKYSKLLTIEKQTTKMHSEIQKAKFGLCAGGITSYEFARMNVPFGIICVTKHQNLTALEWERRKIAKNLGDYDLRLTKAIDKFLKLISENRSLFKKNSSIIDGCGSERIQKEIIKLVN
jgi:spore coat polysaccharide biosynthesis predicted glycosyltransferase SpsG